MQRRNEWVFTKGDLTRDGWESVVDDSLPGWQHTGIRVADIRPGDELPLPVAGVERLVVPLAGSFTIRHQRSEIGRAHV